MRLRPNLIGRTSPPLEPRESVAEQLTRVAPGTRVRIFHREGDERVATSGTVIAFGEGCLAIAPLDGSDVRRVRIDQITCMYLPST